MHYLQESKLARKVEGYLSHAAAQAQASVPAKTSAITPRRPAEATTPVLHHVQSLLHALTNPTAEGRLFYGRSEDGQDITLKYLLLDPTHHFRTIVSEARAVILAGGTMSPMNDYTRHLFSYLPSSQIQTLSCGHVIPKENLVAWSLGSGPSGAEFEFTFEKRDSMVEELGRSILNICRIVPDGVVVFFPSYAYLDLVVQRWQKPTGVGNPSLWDRLKGRKEVFRESRDSSVDEILGEYGRAIGEGKGGLLLSVVGGKMSEGINFSDRLGRCVVIVGLPFPNMHSVEWKSKMEHIESTTVARLRDEGQGEEVEWRAKGKAAGREFYGNACMRAVNQSIGRAIRHRGDYAAIVMIDKRFGSERIKGKLPGWIQEGLVKEAEKKAFAELMGSLATFFRGKKDL
jgi:chromosome transmission fidelity protein 1